MKLLKLSCVALIAEAIGDWEVDFQGELTWDQNDPGFKAFTEMEEELEVKESGLELGINERGKVGTSSKSIERMQLRKYETIKKMTLWLHDESEREWGRYCPYGCHCAVEGPHNLLAGQGRALDEIDTACRRHKDCMACALQDFDQSVCPWWKPYKMDAMIDDETGEKHLVCRDAPGYCKRSLCECDVQLARDLYEERNNYNRELHHRFGSIEPNVQCKAVNRGKSVSAGPQQCCGNYPTRFPFQPTKRECCDGKVSALGSC